MLRLPRANLVASAFALAVAAGVCASVVVPTRADDDAPARVVREVPRVVDPREHRLGELVPDVAFTDIDGVKRSLSALAAEAKALVVVTRSVGCPVGKRYGPELRRLEEAYSARGVAFLFADPIESDDAAALRGERERFGFVAPAVLDADRSIARALGVQTTTEVFVLDPARTLVYRGAVDDQYGIGWGRDAPRRRFLRDALDAVIAGEPPAVEATWAPGCRVETSAGAPAPSADAPTWHGRVSRIVQRNCQGCHRAQGSGPFPLEKLADVRGNREMISFMVENEAMPPWFAAHETGPFENDTSLSERDRKDLLAWIEADCPEGDVADAARPRRFPGGEWSIGKPDLIVGAPKKFDVPAEGTVPYKNVWATSRLKEDRWVEAMEIKPGAPEVVHHVLVLVQYPPGHPRKQPEWRGGIESYFCVMVPGQTVTRFPAGTAKFLPAGARLRFQIHYTPNGTATTDRPRLAFKFADRAPAHELVSQGVHEERFAIPPGVAAHPVKADWTFPKRGKLTGFFPHMHLRGSAFRYELVRTDGTRETVLDVPRYDFNWQLFYRLREPIDVAKGDRIVATGVFDNSADNPANPDPTETVRFGEQTWEEMMIGYIDWYPTE